MRRLVRALRSLQTLAPNIPNPVRLLSTASSSSPSSADASFDSASATGGGPDADVDRAEFTLSPPPPATVPKQNHVSALREAPLRPVPPRARRRGALRGGGGGKEAVEKDQSREVVLSLLEAAMEPPDEDAVEGPGEVREKDWMSLSFGIVGTRNAGKSSRIIAGLNVIIEQSFCAPKVTKDGVTVGKSIEFKDRVKNVGASLVKQVANATNDTAGDGTTCATVLKKAIFIEGCKSVAAGMNAMDLRRGISMDVDAVVTNLKSMARVINTSEEIAQVGTISANGGREIGELIAKAMEKVDKEGVITIADGNTLYNELEVVEHMKLDRGYISPYFITNAKTQKCGILYVRGHRLVRRNGFSSTGRCIQRGANRSHLHGAKYMSSSAHSEESRCYMIGSNGVIEVDESLCETLDEFLLKNPILLPIPNDRLIMVDPKRPHFTSDKGKGLIWSGYLLIHFSHEMGLSTRGTFTMGNGILVYKELGFLVLRDISRLQKKLDTSDDLIEFRVFIQNIIEAQHGPDTDPPKEMFDVLSLTPNSQLEWDVLLHHPFFLNDDLWAWFVFEIYELLRHEIKHLYHPVKAFNIYDHISRRYRGNLDWLNSSLDNPLLEGWISEGRNISLLHAFSSAPPAYGHWITPAMVIGEIRRHGVIHPLEREVFQRLDAWIYKLERENVLTIVTGGKSLTAVTSGLRREAVKRADVYQLLRYTYYRHDEYVVRAFYAEGLWELLKLKRMLPIHFIFCLSSGVHLIKKTGD